MTLAASDEWDLVKEEEYKQRQYFGYNEYIKCAEAVLEALGVPEECWQRLS